MSAPATGRAALLLLAAALTHPPCLAQQPDTPEGVVERDPAALPAFDEALQRARLAAAPSVVEVEALGGLPEAHRVADNADQAKREGVLTKRGFKQAYGPSTGLVVRADGLILTSTFVLNREPRFLVVTLADGRSYVAKLVGRDDGRGLALLRIRAEALPVPRFAARADLQVGRYSLALGRGLATSEPTLALGIISGLGRIGGRALQSSALISPVNYGGPLVSLEGEVQGLIVPLSLRGGMAGVDIYDSGIGFAIPAPDLLGVVERLAGGTAAEPVVLEPGFLGLMPDPTHRGGGVRVAGVAPESPAAAAGIAEGQRVLEVDGAKVDAPWQLRRALAKHYVGDEVELLVERDGKPVQVKVELAERPKQDHGGLGGPPAHPVQPPGKPPGER
jgi:serine protease Do